MACPTRSDRAYAAVMRLKEPGAVRLARETAEAHKAAGAAYDLDVRPALAALIEAKRTGVGVAEAAAAFATCGARHRRACEEYDRILATYGDFCARMTEAAEDAYHRAV